MSEANPLKVTYNMNKYRKMLKLAWKAMQYQYADGVPKPYLLPAMAWAPKAPERTWPSIEDFEIKASRPRGESL